MSNEFLGEIPVREETENLVRIWGKFEDRIRGVYLSIPPGAYNRPKAAQSRRKINRLIMEVRLRTGIWSERAMPKSWDLAERKTENRMRQFKRTEPQGSSRKIRNAIISKSEGLVLKDTVRATAGVLGLFNRYLKLISYANRQIEAKIQEFRNFSKEQIDLLVQEGYETHLARGAISKEILTALLEEIGEGNFLVINGRHYNPRKYAEMLARTRMRELQTRSILKTCSAWRNDLVRFSTHDSPCRICAPLEGTIYSISGNSNIHDPLDTITPPPVHPRCEHNLDPYYEGFKEARDHA